ncbi:hypothetical protein VP1G_08648 [Cytospora mali]|uniref:DUF6594 domain-containing protein n=1 Tax=Cytospora mali TaxID=578113 RepID=A0A194VC42_CYTMA|nr:hypothetical protein VP1G_08648 [Valsa mali var. pyri (nom. inval.)]
MSKTRKEPAKWENDLAKYIQGMRDYDYMRECAERTQDFFMATGERYVDRVVMSVIIDDRAQLHGLEQQDHIEPWQEDDPIPIGDTRRRASGRLWWKGFQERCQLAAIGGVFMLGPMWLMVLHKTLYTGLITTTVCVVIFGFLGSWWLEKPMDVLSATAAYAAVLVAFVGLTTS